MKIRTTFRREKPNNSAKFRDLTYAWEPAYISVCLWCWRSWNFISWMSLLREFLPQRRDDAVNWNDWSDHTCYNLFATFRQARRYKPTNHQCALLNFKLDNQNKKEKKKRCRVTTWSVELVKPIVLYISREGSGSLWALKYARKKCQLDLFCSSLQLVMIILWVTVTATYDCQAMLILGVEYRNELDE